MVACHNFDFDAAKAVGFKTPSCGVPTNGVRLVRGPEPNPIHDIIVDVFGIGGTFGRGLVFPYGGRNRASLAMAMLPIRKIAA